jgi:hypothetical protein
MSSVPMASAPSPSRRWAAGLGGLDWNEVRPRIDAALAELADVRVLILEPSGRPRPTQDGAQWLKLKYVKAPYGPYAENLRHVLHAIEGHLIAGYADGGDAPDKPLTLVPGAVEDASSFLAQHPETRERFNSVVALVDGFESSFGLELLSTVHWVMKHESVTTDTSEKGLETLIMRHMTGTGESTAWPSPRTPPPSARALRRHRLHRRQREGLRPRARARRAAALRLPARHAARGLQEAGAWPMRTTPGHQPPASSCPPVGRDRQARRHRRAAQGRRARAAALRPVLRHASPGNAKAAALHAQNRFSITRQLAYSSDETRRALDLCLFINGLPIATFELKNSLTKQTVDDAVEQYRRDRNPRERLFEFGRCVVHFAVDDSEVRMCTELRGRGSWFLPFNKGHHDGAGNPPNPHGLKTDYLWKEVLTPAA